MNSLLNGNPIGYDAIAKSQRERLLKEAGNARLLRSLDENQITPSVKKRNWKPDLGVIFDLLERAGQHTLHWLRFSSSEPKNETC
jgi:hypothetical protein